MTMTFDMIRNFCPACCRLLDREILEAATGACSDINDLPTYFSSLVGDVDLPAFIADLCRLELAVKEMASSDFDFAPPGDGFRINPSLTILEFAWQGLIDLIAASEDGCPRPTEGREIVLLWKNEGRPPVIRVATDEALLVLKIIAENIPPGEAASVGELPIGAIDRAIAGGVQSGMVLAPKSSICRGDGHFPEGSRPDRQEYGTVKAFSLQWHLTQACDLHCRHCYDRSNRDSLSLEQGIAVLDDLREFCLSRHVAGQVSFSGGNPLLYPHFKELYQAASDRGLAIGILGNPSRKEVLQELTAIQPPAFFQVSLEGLKEHNDYIRGAGHFDRVMNFLEILRELEIYSMVMLTLTRDNLEQVIPLGEALRGRVDSFTFNRLAMVGEGAGLVSADPQRFRRFLAEYHSAAYTNPVLRLKDNLFSLLRIQDGKKHIGGCTRYGCGAAFNFITVLPDGEVHACRKFPSPVGHILYQRLGEIYDSSAAEQYRQGSSACNGCSIRAVCGGCQAVAYGFGVDIFSERDPYCFLDL